MRLLPPSQKACYSSVAWQACAPTELGGLGITDLRLAGTAFQTKWLWLQWTDQDKAWSELPIKSSPEALAFFRASTYTVVGDGKNTLFWTDNWIHGESIQAMAPALLAVVSRQAVRAQTVAQALTNGSWIRQITGGLSMAAIAEYLIVWHQISNYQLNDTADKVIWRSSTDGKFTVRSAYSALHIGSHPIQGCELF